MEKKFTMENNIGIPINYSIIAEVNLEKKYVIYTDFMPSNNEFGVRIFIGEIESEEPFKIKKVSKSKENEILEDFKLQVFQTK